MKVLYHEFLGARWSWMGLRKYNQCSRSEINNNGSGFLNGKAAFLDPDPCFQIFILDPDPTFELQIV